MPSFSLVLEDSSPMLVYSSRWTAGNSADDGQLVKYTESSFMKTQVQGDTMDFTFNGTGITIVGAERGNHGLFSVTLDRVAGQATSSASTTDLFNQTLWASGALQKGTHSVTLKNEEAKFVDIDYVAIELDIGEDNEELIVNTYQDMHPIFSYNPSSSWTIPDNVGGFSGSSGHATLDPTAVAAISFQVRDAIAVYGPVGPNIAKTYKVQIDNQTPSSFSANRQFYKDQQIIFLAANLGPGPHVVSMSLVQPGQALAIDYANIFTTASLGGSFLVAGANSSQNSSISQSFTPSNSQVPIGIIVALAITSAISLVSICGLAYIFWREKSSRRGKTEPEQNINIDPDTVAPFLISSPYSSHPSERGASLPSIQTTQRYPVPSTTNTANSSASKSQIMDSSPPGYQEAASSSHPVTWTV